MFDFALSPYMPSELETLANFHQHCMYKIWNAIRNRQEDAVNDEIIKKEKILSKEQVFSIAPFHDWIWKVLKEGLVKGRETAYTLDVLADKVEIPRQFWLSSYGDNALTSGYIDKIELFAPIGIIYIQAEQMAPVLSAIYKNMYDDTSIDNDGSLKFSSVSPSVIDGMIGETKENSGDKFDKDLFYQILVCEIHTSGFPDNLRGSQTAFRQRLIDAYAQAGGPGGAPSMPWVKSRVLPIQRRLRMIDEGGSDDTAVPLLPSK